MTSLISKAGIIGAAGALIVCLSACGTTTAPPAQLTFHETVLIAPPCRPVVRQGRYTLVEITPEESQRDLLSQVIDLSIPLSQGGVENSVGEAMRYVLQRSGYRLCESSTVFDTLPLPVAHARLGPIRLRDALSVLAGSAWMLQTDETARQVCFVPDPKKAEGTK